MKTILTIGSWHFVLPASANVNAVLTALSKCSQVDRDWSSAKIEEIYRPAKHIAEVNVKLVKDDQVLTFENPKRKALPEKASPDAHNTFGS